MNRLNFLSWEVIKVRHTDFYRLYNLKKKFQENEWLETYTFEHRHEISYFTVDKLIVSIFLSDRD